MIPTQAGVSAMQYTDSEWEPGLPLYSRAGHAHSQYLYNFRDEIDNSENCNCTDRASWPVPLSHHALSEGDDLRGVAS